ncbi:MAG: tetratricopeptide repeat protein [Magnetococcales bacterium]|nr:tetratricopeptide repeat protein [Magnetococcales bacterium]
MTAQPSVMDTVSQALEQGHAFYLAGQPREAERVYRAILQREPTHPEANHNLGVLRLQAGETLECLAHFKAAVEAEPGQGHYWLSYLDALLHAGQHRSAAEVLARARSLGLRGEAVESLAARLERGGDLHPRGLAPGTDQRMTTLFIQGRYGELERLAREILARFPDDSMGWKGLGIALSHQERFDEAREPLLKVLALSPDDDAVRGYLGLDPPAWQVACCRKWGVGSLVGHVRLREQSVRLEQQARRLYPGPDYLTILNLCHAALRPSGYLEIGVAHGDSLALAGKGCLVHAVDPDAAIRMPIQGEVALFDLTSEAYFADVTLHPPGGVRFDLVFIDGLHTFDQAFRDLVNALTRTHDRSVLVVHDVLPVDELSARRVRESLYWAGDVWKMTLLIERLLPDARITTLPVYPTGLMFVRHPPLTREQAGELLRHASMLSDELLELPWPASREALEARTRKVREESLCALEGILFRWGENGSDALYAVDCPQRVNELGNRFFRQEQFPQAEICYRQVLTDQPAWVVAHNNLGAVLWRQGRAGEAATCFHQALALQPDDPDTLRNFGNFLLERAHYPEAEACFRRALALPGDPAEPLFGLGNALQLQNRLAEAETFYRQLLELQPGHARAYSNLGTMQLKQGRLPAAEESYRRALRQAPDSVELFSNLLLAQNYRGDGKLEVALDDARKYGALVASLARPFQHRPDPAAANRPLRVGLVSGDFHAHPVGHFLEGVVACLRPETLELFAYATAERDDAVKRRLLRIIPHWRGVGRMGDEALARLIQEDGIDILVDLAGHNAHNRLSLFAWKPAPVQVAWLGYFATTGVGEMDYILCDAINLPENEAWHFVETPWRLPECHLCFTPPEFPLEVAPLPALTNGFITFGCFNAWSKVTPAVLECWAAILSAVPGSRLFLKNASLGEPVIRQEVLAWFAQRHIPAGRLILEGEESREGYLACYHRVDIGLDPFPFPGGTVTVEGLWMGVPVVTLKGDRFVSHQGETLLANAGLSCWIGGNQEEYRARAIDFASDPNRLSSLRAGLRRQVLSSPLFDAPRFAGHLTRALRGMWRRWCVSGNH